MIFRPSRTTREDRFVNEKMLTFVIGALLGVAGIAFEIGWLIYLAIGVLAIGLVLRVLSQRGSG